MARPEEKAKSSLSRWLAQQRQENGQAPQKQKRPYLASLCDNLKDATKWRAQILREVSAQVTLIQNGTMTRQISSLFRSRLDVAFLPPFSDFNYLFR